jgi:signal transduction histidine kinase
VEPSAWERLRRVDPRIWDALLAAAVVVLGLTGFLLRGPEPNDPPGAYGVALMVVASVALAWRRRAPLTVAAIVAAAASTAALGGWWPEFVPLVWIALYSAAAYGARERLVAVLLPVALVTSVAISVGEHADRGVNWVEIVSELFLTAGIPIVLGRMTANRHRRILRDREIAAKDAVTAERARIARELHDVVAHHMSVMIVQAGAARTVGARDPEAAAAALEQIEESGRTGLAEMRRLLDLLQAPEDGDGLAPQPGLARLEELLEATRATGIAVELSVEGPERPVPAGVDLSAFRIVQEALTNVLKHSGSTTASVRLAYRPDALEIEVTDDGIGAPDGIAGHGERHGLVGMRERAALFGGTFEAGPRPGGGFVVRARLPLAAAEAAP